MEIDTYEKEQNLLPPADLVAEIKMLKEELLNERDRNLRTLADFKNYRRRIERDGNKIAEASIREMILAILDIIDDLEKVIEYAKGAKLPSVEELQIITKKFRTMLESRGVFHFDCIGTTFDHNLHEAVAMATHEGSEPRTVVDELRRGYLWNNELLRPAKVRVSG